jgi:hypothetical protein
MTIPEIEDFLSSSVLPNSIELDSVHIITNVNLFIETHLSTIKAYPDSKAFKPHKDRLLQVINILQNER